MQYAYADGASGGIAKYVRLNYVVYPGGPRTIYYNYGGTAASAVRIADIADGSGEGRSKYADYTYLGAATVVKVAHPAVSGGLELTYGTGGTYGGFDRFGRIIDQKWQNDTPAVKDQFQYGYDRNSNRLYADNTQTTGKDWKYEYDNLDRVSDARRGTLDDPPSNGLVSTGYRQYWETLEALGNWKDFKVDNDGAGGGGNWELEQTRTHNKVNEITGISDGAADWIDPDYDMAGNMTEGPKPGDEATATQRQFCVYDAWNRLVEVWRDKDGDGVKDDEPDDEQLAEYRYDGQNRRIVKTDKTGESDVTYDYYYSGWRVLEIRKDSDTDPYDQYVWSIRYVHSAVCRFRDGNTDGDYDDTGDNTDDNLYFTNDANFNVTALIDPSNGNPVERYVYDPYGKVTIYNSDWSATVAWADSRKNPILYTGHRWDNETGLYYAGYRYYHPTLGRWVQREPPGYEYVDGMSLYEYVGSNPTDQIDPWGLSPKDVKGKDCELWWSKKVHGDEQKGKSAKIPYHGWLAQGNTFPRNKVWDFGPNLPLVNAELDGQWRYKDNRGQWQVRTRDQFSSEVRKKLRKIRDRKKRSRDRKGKGSGRLGPSDFVWALTAGCEGMTDYSVRRDGTEYYGEDKREFRHTPLKLKWDFWFLKNKLQAGGAGVKGTLCCAATCDQINSCLQAVETSWNTTEYDWVWRNCMSFADEAMNKCCLRK